MSYVVDKVVDKLLEAVNKKNKAAPVKPFQVKSHLWVFVNCLVENPTFDSQTKENMTLKVLYLRVLFRFWFEWGWLPPDFVVTLYTHHLLGQIFWL